LVFFLIILLLPIQYFSFDQKTLKNKIYPNVFIDNMDFSGKTKKQVIDHYQKKSALLKNLSFQISYDQEIVATFSAQVLDLRYDGDTAAEQAYTIGRSRYFLSRFFQRLTSVLKLKKYYFSSQIDYDTTPVKEFLAIEEQNHNHPAENALFKFEKEKVVSFRPEKKGLEIQSSLFMEEFKKNLDHLKDGRYKKTLVLQNRIIVPEITLASVNNLGVEEIIGTGVSDYTHSMNERIHNLLLATSKFNGVLIPPDKTLSFNETVGDISSLTGYRPAYIIKEGKTVLGDGGGVCQVSTTLFRAALNAGLPIIERHAHAYRVLYYENDSRPGFDATVFSPSVDLKIKNDTDSYILIETRSDQENNLLYFNFYGKKDGRQVEISPATVWDVIAPPEPKYQEDPLQKKGITKQIDFPAWGSKASFDYKVYKKGNLIINEKFLSVYKPWQAIFLVGTAD